MTEELPFYQYCFVCGDKRRGSLGLRFRRENEKVIADFLPLEKHIGYPGMIHGGILAAVLDEAMAWAVFAKAGHFAISAEIKVRYITPLPPGHPVRVMAYVVNRRHRIYEVTGEIADTRGVIFARAWGRSVLAPSDQDQEWVKVIREKPRVKTKRPQP